MMDKKPRSPRSFVPTPKSPRFVFDRDSTKDFGGMVIDRKVTIDAINKSSRTRKERPSFGGKPKKDVVAPPKGGPNGAGNRAGMGNKQSNKNRSYGGPGGPNAAERFKNRKTKKRPPIVIDPRF